MYLWALDFFCRCDVFCGLIQGGVVAGFECIDFRKGAVPRGPIVVPFWGKKNSIR